MIHFKALELKDREIFEEYLREYSFNTYEYSFITLYLWRQMYNIEYGILDNALIIKKTHKHFGSYFMQPIGYEKEALKNIVIKLHELKQNSSGFVNLFRDIENPFLNELIDIFGNDLKISEDINNFDYIYDCKKLASLSGKKYHSKKNQYNQFINNYDYKLKDLKDKQVITDCINFAAGWYEKRGAGNEMLKYELEGIKEVLLNYQFLNLQGMAVYVHEKLAGFAIGEKVNRKMAIVHIEKADPAFRGVYAFLSKMFVQNYFLDVGFINRQEDLGIEGLRRAKMAYNPVRLEKKYIVDLNI